MNKSGSKAERARALPPWEREGKLGGWPLHGVYVDEAFASAEWLHHRVARADGPSLHPLGVALHQAQSVVQEGHVLEMWRRGRAGWLLGYFGPAVHADIAEALDAGVRVQLETVQAFPLVTIGDEPPRMGTIVPELMYLFGTDFPA